jgi:NADH-ubiquinone oxidoreductase chain 4
MLLSLLIIPIIGLFLIFNPISYDENTNNIYNKERASRMLIHSKNITLIVTGINLLLSLIIFAIFNFSVQEFQFVQEHYNISYFDIYLGIDGISIYFILLTTGIIPIALIAN